MSLRVGLTYDLRSEYLAAGYSETDVAEFDSDETIAALVATLRGLGHKVTRIGNARALAARLVKGDRWDLVFNIAEGLKGRSRESQVPALLELYDIPYTFSDPLVSAVTMDKGVAKKIVRQAGLATPAFAVVSTPAEAARVKLRYPLFVKPIAEGTGKGMDQGSVIRRPAELKQRCTHLLLVYRQPVLVEEFLPGREFTVGILGTGAEARAIGTMEVVLLPSAGGLVYGYETKEKCEELCKYSRLSESRLKRAVEQLAVAAYVALECRDAGRVDIRLDGRGKPSFMEVNTMPGLHPSHSDLPMIATQEGMSYARLIGAIVRNAARRQGLKA